MPRPPYDPDWYPCGHPRTPENTRSQNKCKECRRLHNVAEAQKAREAAGRIRRGDPDWFPCGHARTAANTTKASGCRACKSAKRQAAYSAKLSAEGKTRVAVDPERFPCGHPRTPENKKSQGKCRECARLKAKAYHHAKVTAQGRELRVMDPDWFPCGHPRVAGNLAPRRQCRVCHIDRAMKSYRENPGSHRKNAAAHLERERTYKACRREERTDPDTMDYLRIIRADPCSYCGGPGGTRDHVIPVSAGGANHWTNYTGACASCNVGKNDKPLLSYLLHRMEIAKAREAKTA